MSLIEKIGEGMLNLVPSKKFIEKWMNPRRFLTGVFISIWVVMFFYYAIDNGSVDFFVITAAIFVSILFSSVLFIILLFVQGLLATYKRIYSAISSERLIKKTSQEKFGVPELISAFTFYVVFFYLNFDS